MSPKYRPKDVHERYLGPAKAAGIGIPLWAAGVILKRQSDKPRPNAHDIIMEGRRRAGIVGEPDLPPLGPPLPDPYAED